MSVRDGTGSRSQEGYIEEREDGEGGEGRGRTKWRVRKQEQKKAVEEEGWLPRDAPRHNGEN